jgi:hypothetical protein
VQFSDVVNGMAAPNLSRYGRISYQQSFDSAGWRGCLLNAIARDVEWPHHARREPVDQLSLRVDADRQPIDVDRVVHAQMLADHL